VVPVHLEIDPPLHSCGAVSDSGGT
jgi:hypothetical protein